MESLRLVKTDPAKNIESTLAYLKKLFIMPDSSDRFVEFGVHLLDLIRDFFKERGGIHSSVSIEELQELFSTVDIPETPARIRDVLTEIKSNVIRHSVKVSSPYYIGHMTSAVPYFMILLEMISVSLNQNQVKIETAKASSFVEREFLSWLHRLVFQKPEPFYRKNVQNHRVSLGAVTSDGSLANLTALAVAVAKAFPPDGGTFRGVRREGLQRALQHYGCRNAVILVSKRGHYSIQKAGSVLGLGSDNIISIPVEPGTHKMSIKKLEKQIRSIRRRDRRTGMPTKIVALIGIAGTTETGSVDDLEALCRIAEETGAHFHVDAAWGGGALLMENGRSIMRGIEKAGSVTIDAHKLLYAPNTMGICLFRNPRDSRYLYHTSDYIIRRGSVDQGRFTLEGSRPFACLKPWAAFKILGADGYREIFKHAADLQHRFVRLVKNSDALELCNTPELFIINYRFVPPELQKQLAACMRSPRSHARSITALNRGINKINVELHKTIREHDMSFVSRTALESTCYAPRKIVVLRAVTVNPLTEPDMLDAVIDEHVRLGTLIWNRLKTDMRPPSVVPVLSS